MVDDMLNSESSIRRDEIVNDFIPRWSHSLFDFNQEYLKKGTTMRNKENLLNKIRRDLIDEVATRLVHNLSEDEISEAVCGAISLDKIVDENTERAFDYVVEQLVEEVGDFDDMESELLDKVMDIIND
jgi:hypothetical protein